MHARHGALQLLRLELSLRHTLVRVGIVLSGASPRPPFEVEGSATMPATMRMPTGSPSALGLAGPVPDTFLRTSAACTLALLPATR